jgi:hypothetical protein
MITVHESRIITPRNTPRITPRKTAKIATSKNEDNM